MSDQSQLVAGVSPKQASTLAEMAAPAPADDITAIRAELAAELAKAKELTAKLTLKAEIREEVSEAVMQQRREQFAKMALPEKPVMPTKPEGVEMVPIKLIRNYRPKDYYEIVGYQKEAVITKDLSGVVRTLEAACFVKGEQKPPKVSGSGFATKIWADTVIRLPMDEAKAVKNAGIGSVELAD